MESRRIGRRHPPWVRCAGLVVDLLVPPVCPGCGVEGETLCRRCTAPLRRRLDEPAGIPIGLPGDLPDGIVQLEWCASITGPVRAALHALKYDGARRLAEPLGAALAQRWRRAAAGGDLLVPVPVHAARRRERGYDQAVLLAGACGRALGLPVREALVRVESTQAQHGLGRTDRTANVSGAFAVAEPYRRVVQGRWIVVVDDVVTTGATLSGCAAALYRAGALAVSGLAVARER